MQEYLLHFLPQTQRTTHCWVPISYGRCHSYQEPKGHSHCELQKSEPLFDSKSILGFCPVLYATDTFSKHHCQDKGQNEQKAPWARGDTAHPSGLSQLSGSVLSICTLIQAKVLKWVSHRVKVTSPSCNANSEMMWALFMNNGQAKAVVSLHLCTSYTMRTKNNRGIAYIIIKGFVQRSEHIPISYRKCTFRCKNHQTTLRNFLLLTTLGKDN